MATPHWSQEVRQASTTMDWSYKGPGDLAFHRCPPRSQDNDLSMFDFFLWEMSKAEFTYVPPLPTALSDVEKIEKAFSRPKYILKSETFRTKPYPCR